LAAAQDSSKKVTLATAEANLNPTKGWD
jgi:hypothetical protein